ncbi:MAG: hypothetical protein ACK5WP_09560 [Neisseriaceae bacterium]
MKLNNRQLEILYLIGKFRFLSFKNIEHYFDLSSNAVILLANRLKSNGYVRIEKIFHNGDKYLLLDKHGSDFLGYKYFKKINHVTLIHDEYVNTIAIDQLKKGNQIKLEHEFKEENLLKFEQKNKIIFPDIVVNDTAYEIEISLKNLSRIKNKILKLDSMYNIKTVEWISNSSHILEKISKSCFNNNHKFYKFDNNILGKTKVEFKQENKEFTL